MMNNAACQLVGLFRVSKLSYQLLYALHELHHEDIPEQ